VANHLIQLIDAAELLVETRAYFLLIGDGMQKPMLKEEVKSRGIKNVEFIDSVPKSEVFKFILASDLGASVLKRVDTFKTIYSNKTFDYMSCAVPILLCIDGVSRELVKKAQCGFYAEPEDSESIKETILYAMEGGVDLNSVGKNGYNYAKENFDRIKLANRYILELQKTLRTDNV
jgi:glycosyltransferase involved in cell wall biosynthesis